MFCFLPWYFDNYSQSAISVEFGRIAGIGKYSIDDNARIETVVIERHWGHRRWLVAVDEVMTQAIVRHHISGHRWGCGARRWPLSVVVTTTTTTATTAQTRHTTTTGRLTVGRVFVICFVRLFFKLHKRFGEMIGIFSLVLCQTFFFWNFVCCQLIYY